MDQTEGSFSRVRDMSNEDDIEEIEDVDRIEELQQAEDLVQKLSADREEKRRELSQALEDTEESQPTASKPPPKPAKRKLSRLKKSATLAPPSEDDVEDIPTIPTLPDEGETEDEEMGKTPKGGKKKALGFADAASASKLGKSSVGLNASIQERIKRRIMEAKEKAEKSLKEEVEKDPDRDLPGRRLRGLRARDLATRFDDPTGMTKEEIEEDKLLQESIAAKSKWQAAFKAVKKKESDIPTAEEALDFFTRIYVPEPETPRPDETQPTTSAAADEPPAESAHEEDEAAPAEEEEGVEEGQEAKPLTAAHFVDSDDYILRPAEMIGAVYFPMKARAENEKKFYFVPNAKPVPASEKVPENTEPRYLEDEGFYVGVRPEVSARNQNVMENRLLKRPDKGAKWFGEDGQICVLPDPLKNVLTRPQIRSNEEREPGLQTVFKKAIPADSDQGYFSSGNLYEAQFQLDVDVNLLVFTHHSLFSKEHVLASRLGQMYDQFLKRKKRDMAEYLTEKLGALKQAVRVLHEHLYNMQNQVEEETPALKEATQNLESYKYEIRQTKRLRDNELQHDRTLLKNILKYWRQMKAVRAEEGCTNTPLKLSVRKEQTDRDEDEDVLKGLIQEEVDEMQEVYQEDYLKQVEQYNAAMVEWKEFQKKRKKSKKIKKRGSQENLTEDAEDEAGTSDDILNVPKPIKPEYEFDEETTMQTIRSKLLKIRRRPGEPIIIPELSNTAVITPTHECPRPEQQRRADMQKAKYLVKVLVNNKEVSRTSIRTLTSDFTIHFGDIFNVQVAQWPDNIKLQIFETGSLVNHMLAELYLPVPDAQMTSDKVTLEDMEFSSDQRIGFDHRAVGSGYPFFMGEGDTKQELSLLTSGNLYSSTAWGLAEDDTPLIPPIMEQGESHSTNSVKHVDAISALGATGIVDMDKLSKWAAKARLDPNDPSNAFLLHILKDGQSNYSIPDYFRLEQFQQEFDFVTDEDIHQSKRFRLLELRQKEVQEFRGLTLVAPNDKEIEDNIFANYEKRIKQEEEGFVEEGMDPHRVAVARFLCKVRQQVMARFKASKHRYLLQDVVDEALVPDVSLLGDTLSKLTQPRRPLRPNRKERKFITAQNLTGLDIHILVNIERAFEIPDRKSSRQANSAQPFQQRSSVRPFVEVMFQDNIKQTSIADGTNPNFNEELSLPFKAPNSDYSAANLETVQDEIYFNLFDEFVVDILEDERQRDTNIHQRLERRWLGSVSIPFSTVYFQGRVSGAVRLESPSVLLGYERSTESVGRGVANASYLSIFITIEPPLTTPEPFREKFESREDEKLLAHSESFAFDFFKKFPKRELKTTVIDINGYSVFITRYFRPLKPPEELLDSNPTKAAEKVARFVSLVPSISDSVVFPGVCDIWSTCEQFLQMLQGDEEEHAVLLVNYFLHMGKKTWLILGRAIPEGPTTYVATEEIDGTIHIWNPSTGEHYDYQDTFCPLKSVGCLVNHENIWANVQVNDEPSRIDFDLSKTGLWKPLFNRSFPNPGLSSVQPEELAYVQTDREYVADLQDKIEKKLRDCVMDWRSRHVTRWNRYCTQVFRQILKKLEQSYGVAEDYSSDLSQILESYNLCGFPLQMPYTDMRSVISRVRSTGVHNNESSDIEFALAVHIHPYPSNVMSVWVYIASLSRKR